MDALCRTMCIGLEVKDKLFELCELVIGDLGESGMDVTRERSMAFSLVTAMAMLSRWFSNSERVGR